MAHSKRVIITIDGPAGTGKSSAAAQLAGRLGLEVLDTGSMYRAATLVAIENDIDIHNGEGLARAVEEAHIGFDWQRQPPGIRIGERDVSERIRELDVSSAVSIVSAHKAIRDVMVHRQRDIAVAHPGLVTEGRDQGSVVFPDATARFFLAADVGVRVKRRAHQMEEAGKPVAESAIRENIESRDQIDTSRAEAPLRCPPGAIIVDTSKLSLAEVVDVLEKESRAVLLSKK
jgi:cytidylate kinase